MDEEITSRFRSKRGNIEEWIPPGFGQPRKPPGTDEDTGLDEGGGRGGGAGGRGRGGGAGGRGRGAGGRSKGGPPRATSSTDAAKRESAKKLLEGMSGMLGPLSEMRKEALKSLTSTEEHAELTAQPVLAMADALLASFRDADAKLAKIGYHHLGPSEQQKLEELRQTAARAVKELGALRKEHGLASGGTRQDASFEDTARALVEWMRSDAASLPAPGFVRAAMLAGRSLAAALP